jgi:hypothetical protein
MANLEQRIDRQLKAMPEAEKRKLLDTHIGPVIGEPDPEADEKYLRHIVGGMLRDHDERQEAIKSSGIAELERRVKKLEAILGPRGDKLLDVLSEATGKALRGLLKREGYMRHAGTWIEDHTYSKGDCVVAGGATWLAIAAPPKGTKPGAALEWRLIVKGESK